jgi:hypothetical protein
VSFIEKIRPVENLMDLGRFWVNGEVNGELTLKKRRRGNNSRVSVKCKK